jgi:rhodanese-related sulfurtransferase
MECHAAARRAAKLGYTDLYIMPEGIVGWIKAKMPVVTGDKPGG